VNLIHDPWLDRLSEHLDGTLSEEERVLLDAHLATCADCTTTLAQLGQVVARARVLPAPGPELDLWPGIAARVAALAQPPQLPLSWHTTGRRAPGGITLSWPQLMAAGIALIALSGGGMWLVTRMPRGNATATSRNSGLTTQPASHDADPAYVAEVTDLERILAEKRDQLDPETVRTIETNLKIIDLATMQARQALAADPANPYLREYLSKSMRRKVELLKQATEFASAQ
jgi:hypothetical protein